ncbi:hypothetical protein MNBD_GAMMA08-1562 [hydrothermal vent metagenome]|uniref:Uncharacterized protein n=1 Tax=hydrothermal vent metagenome TaxID=652676 RepID=A0A3B0XJD8_9ZZZZ
MDSIFTPIASELNRINKLGWLNVIKILEENFEEYPVDSDDQKPAAAILKILQSLDPDDATEVRFIYRVKQLDCFTYRACYTNQKQEDIFWNPLKEKFCDFMKNAPNNYQADMEYPATDIIQKWLIQQI